MPIISIKINNLGDPPVYVAPPTELELTTVHVLEHGTESGATSLMFELKRGDQIYVAQTTLALLNYVYHAALGADQRFKDKKRNN